MVAFFKTQIGRLSACGARCRKAEQPRNRRAGARPAVEPHVLARWRKYLRESKKSDEPVFRLWHGAAAIPDKSSPPSGQKYRGSATGNPLVRKELEARQIAVSGSRGAYAAVLAKHDRAEPFSDAPAEQLRAVVRGPKSPVDVPLEEFELICTEGDSNNTALDSRPLQHDARAGRL